jgi:hypothetical protein
MERVFLRFVLLSKNSIKAIQSYCLDRSICDRQRDIVAKKMLGISGYKTPDDVPEIDPVVVLYELLGFSAKLKTKDPENPLKASPELIKLVADNGSLQTRAYFAYNGIELPKASFLSKLKNTGGNLLDLARSSELTGKALEAGKGFLINKGISEYNKLQNTSSSNDTAVPKKTKKPAKKAIKKPVTKSVPKKSKK